jgi:N6-L-threonylcarbamoyladenine synthase
MGDDKGVKMIILSVETSCDETSVAITQDGQKVLSNIVLSQMNTHALYGGVVPEIASREHVKGIHIVFKEALEKANVLAKDIDFVAVTQGPGLIGSLLVGINAAKAFAFAHQKPIIGVHHIVGHIYANQIVKPMVFPLIALVISGGHTELILMKDHVHFERLGKTEDDAIGEAYDKVARVLDLGYPGGPKLDLLASEGKPTYPMPEIQVKDFNFSYSGLKSHIINLHHHHQQKNEPVNKADLAASFQEAAFKQIFNKTLKAIEIYQPKQLLIAGGVASNSYIRNHQDALNKHVEVIIPPLEYCTDNAAMIGIAAYYQWQKDPETYPMNFNGDARLSIEFKN